MSIQYRTGSTCFSDKSHLKISKTLLYHPLNPFNAAAKLAPSSKPLFQDGVDVLGSKARHSQELVTAASQPWPLHKTFRKEEKFAEERVGVSLMINPLTAMFRSTRVKLDYLVSGGWKTARLVDVLITS